MIAVLLTSKFVYGDFILDALTNIVDPRLLGKITVGLQPSSLSIGAFFVNISAMMIAVLISVVAFLMLFISALYIPLPNHICDRQKIQIFEFLIRLTNEYFGDLVELLFGNKMRIYLSRFIVGFPYFFQRKPPKWCNIQIREIAGVTCRIYTPDASMRKSDALLIFIHGGGWMLMRPNYYDGPMYAIIAKTGMTVVSIDYKLAPKVTFPSPILECEKVVKTIYEEEYRNLNIDRTKISIMGDSAGGNLSAVICQRLLRAGLAHYVKSQVLIYPATNFTDFQSPSYQYYENAYKGTGLLNPRIFARMVLVYLGIEVNPKNIQLINQNKHVPKEIRESKEFKAITSHSLLPSSFKQKDLYTEPETPHPDPKLSQLFSPFLLNPDLNPIFGKNLEGLPEAMIITVGIDILRDEGVLYGKRLESFNVPVKWFHYERAFHGIMNMPKSRQRKRIIEDIVSFLENKI